MLSELEGKFFGDLAPKDRRRLENRTIRCIVITEDSHPDIKFDVFERLNTGAASLTAQELRNSVYRGEFNDALKALGVESYFTDLMGGLGNKRMDHEELILRFLAIHEGLISYKPPLRQTLNTYMRKHRRSVPSEEMVALFEQTCLTVGEVLGSFPFKVAGSKNPVNKAMFDAVMIPFSFADLAAIRDRADGVREMFEGLAGDDRFRTAIGRATADRSRMLYRVGRVADNLRELGIPVLLPEGFGLDSSI